MRIGYRLPPGIDPRELSEAAATLVRGEGTTRVDLATIGMEQPVRVSRTNPLARAFARAIAEVGGQTTFKEKSGTSDMNILSPAWGVPMVAYGPGDSRCDHKPIERLALADYARGESVVRGVCRRG